MSRQHTRHGLFLRKKRGNAANSLETILAKKRTLTSTTARSSSHRALDAGLSSTLLQEGRGRVREPRHLDRGRAVSFDSFAHRRPNVGPTASNSF